jgi:hypothetical protein
MSKHVFTNPVLVIYTHDVKDEFEAKGFAIEEASDMQTHIALCRETGKVAPGPRFGNLGSPDYDDVDDYIRSLNIQPLTQEEVQVFQKFFPGRIFMRFGKVPEFYLDEEELREPGRKW